MNLFKYLKIPTTIVIFISIFLIFFKDLQLAANEIISLTVFKKENQEIQYAQPTSIAIVTIPLDVDNYNIENVANEINFYAVSKLGFAFSPFHYLVDQKGNVYKNHDLGEYAKIDIKNLQKGTIIIGYYENLKTDSIPSGSLDSIKSLCLYLANNFNIKFDDIFIGNLVFQKNANEKYVDTVFNESFGNWKKILLDVQNYISQYFAPIKKDYEVIIKDVVITNQNILPEEEIEIKLTLQNLSKDIIFENSNSEIFITKKDNTDSLLYDQNTWVSKSQIKIMHEDTILTPQSINEFFVKFRAPLFVGNITEQFELRNLMGTKIKSSEFRISVNINRPNYKIIEIPNNQGFSQMNIRSEPSSVANIIGYASVGQRFKVLAEAGNGYIKIKQNNGLEGWIAGWLVREI